MKLPGPVAKILERCNLLAVTIALLLLATVAPMVQPALSAPNGIIQQSVAECDPWYPTMCAAPGGSGYTNITTATSTVLKTSAATLASLVINTGGAGSSAVVYDNTTCTGTKIGTFSTATQGAIQVNARAGTGLCVTTSGGTPADLTVLWR